MVIKMKTIELLETLASAPHYSHNFNELAGSQPEEIKRAFAENDADLLSKALSKGLTPANITKVVAG